MKRRDCLKLLGAAAASSVLCPLVVRAQQKVPVIGFLGTTSPATWRQPVAATLLALADEVIE